MSLGLSPDVFEHSLLPLLSVQDLLKLRLVNKQLKSTIDTSKIWLQRAVVDFQEGLRPQEPLIDEYIERANATLLIAYRDDPDTKLSVPIKRNKQVRDIVFTSTMHVMLYANRKAGFYRANYHEKKIATCWFGSPKGYYSQIKRIGQYIALLETSDQLRLFCYVPKYQAPAEVKHELNLPACDQLTDVKMDDTLWIKSSDGTKVFHIQALHRAGSKTTFEARIIYDSIEVHVPPSFASPAPPAAPPASPWGRSSTLMNICSATLCADARTGKGFKSPAPLFSGKPTVTLTFSLEVLVGVTTEGLMIARWNLLKEHNGMNRAPIQAATAMNDQWQDGERFVVVEACECLVTAVTSFGRVIDGILYIDMNSKTPLDWTMVRQVPNIENAAGISYLNVDHDGHPGCIHGVGYTRNGTQIRWFRELFRERGSTFVPLQAEVPFGLPRTKSTIVMEF